MGLAGKFSASFFFVSCSSVIQAKFDINLPSEYSDDKALVVIKIFISAGIGGGAASSKKRRERAKRRTFTMINTI